MARVSLVTQQIVPGAITPAFSAGTDVGATFVFDADAYIEVVNANAGTVVLTLETPGTVGGRPITAPTFSIPTGTRRKIGGFDKRAFARATGVSDAGRVYANLDIVSSVTAGAFKA